MEKLEFYSRAHQMDLCKVEKQFGMDLMKFDKAKCKVLQLRRQNSVHKYILETD